MTIKKFWENPYQTEITTIVESVDGNIIRLNETIFYAFSGGQESDHGTIGGFEVIKAEKHNSDIFYTLPEHHELQKNDSVSVIIDWKRRYRLMKLHFAAEIVLELFNRSHPFIPKVGAHIAERKARIDFKCNKNLSKLISELENDAQSIIDKRLPIISEFSDRINERRYWKIEGFSSVPCGGTHVKNTAEIGNIKLKRVNPGKGLERIEIIIEDAL